MDATLDPVETRVLGCLIEKELATPEYYPMSLNALVNACNQRSNREPVLDLSEPEVSRALASLGRRQFAIVSGEGGRVPKHRHFLVEKFDLDRRALAVLCELMVRGPQTPGELRARAGRMADFPDLASVADTLGRLDGEAPPLVACLPRQPGRKEARYAQLLSGMPAEGPAQDRPAADVPRGAQAVAEPERIAALEAEVAALREETAALRAEIAELARLVVG
jgi:uncharacterized protein YceH (UPF0502 family)